MKIAIGSDHAGFKLKETVKEFLKTSGIEVIDFGTHSEESADYPDFAFPVAEAIAK
ncbi:MAG: RpiB/LacA/LacB family sugar-phosphate isomerase, partial [Caldiserica bacterium]|nr:RpiB/LacA/LacB family sugar-phosphate isomerase [Caldisericota bacterium]